MSGISRKQELNEAFKRFQRLPDWPIANLPPARSPCRGAAAEHFPQEPTPAAEASDESPCLPEALAHDSSTSLTTIIPAL